MTATLTLITQTAEDPDEDSTAAASLEAANSKSHASWKLNALDAVVGFLTAPEFRVFYSLLQHANRTTKLIMPSQERLSILLGCNPSTIERAVAGLIAKNVLKITRKNRQKTNRYEINQEEIQVLANKRLGRVQHARDRRDARLAHTSGSDPSKSTEQDPALVRAREPADLTGKHLNSTPC